MFDFSSGSEEENPVNDNPVHNVTNDADPDASINKTKQLEVTVIDELSQRLTSIMSRVKKRPKKLKEQKKKQLSETFVFNRGATICSRKEYFATSFHNAR